MIPAKLQTGIFEDYRTGIWHSLRKLWKLLETFVFRPNMNRDIDKMLLQCKTCMDFRIQKLCVGAYTLWSRTNNRDIFVHGGDYWEDKDCSRFILKLWNSLTQRVTQLLTGWSISLPSVLYRLRLSVTMDQSTHHRIVESLRDGFIDDKMWPLTLDVLKTEEHYRLAKNLMKLLTFISIKQFSKMDLIAIWKISW